MAFKIRSSTLAAEDSPQVSSIKLNTAPLDFFTLKLKRGALLQPPLSKKCARAGCGIQNPQQQGCCCGAPMDGFTACFECYNRPSPQRTKVLRIALR